MPDNRSISNPLALAVLTLLYERPMHPYQMATTLREREKEESIKLRFGSLYSVIDRLQQEGLIVAGEKVREGKRPERTIYHITDAGKDVMRDWLREIVSTPIKEYPQFEAGLSLLPGLPPDEAVEMLKARLNPLDDWIQEIDDQHRQEAEMGMHPLFMIESEYRRAMLAAERDWVRHLIDRLMDEDWANARLIDGVPSWRQMHEQRESGASS